MGTPESRLISDERASFVTHQHATPATQPTSGGVHLRNDRLPTEQYMHPTSWCAAPHERAGVFPDDAGASEALERQRQETPLSTRRIVPALADIARRTAGHSAAVAVYSRDIAAELGLADGEQQLAYWCGLVHDLGKIGLPEGLLEKAGALTSAERREVERHPVIGERILAILDPDGPSATIVRHHHERIDGNGYPDGLRGERIPLLSRVLAVADTYNAMTSDRPYRGAVTPDLARACLTQVAGTQLDSRVVAAFEAVLVRADEPYKLARGAAFRVECGPCTPSATSLYARGQRTNIRRWA
jgi:HD-GYP domain-containing protein (c-di-GMP phosphodiesterase class II)